MATTANMTTPAQPDGSNSLYVGSLDPRVCTELLEEVFSLAGRVTLCRVVADRASGTSMRFGFVDYADHDTALKALTMFNGRNIYGSAMTVDWAHAGAGAAAGRNNDDASNLSNLSSHFCLFIGNLSSDVTDEALRHAFSQFGSCSSAKVARDPGATKNHGYAFVSFREKASAEAAIEALDGQVMNNRPLRVDWAKTKTNPATRGGDGEAGGGRNNSGARKSMEQIRGETTLANATAYVAGLSATTSDDEIRAAFQQYGVIHEVRIPDSVKSTRADNLYAFVRYADHEAATLAIHECQDGHKTVAGRPVTVHWGREGGGRRPMGRGMHQHQQYNNHNAGPMQGYNQPYNSQNPQPQGNNYRAFGQRYRQY